ncbi:hypothetical protein Tco_0936269 [Tanacetum coccineum]
MGDREVVNQVFVGDPVDNEMTKDDSIDISCSIVPIRRSMKRKKVEFDETASEYAPTGNPTKRRRLNKDERCETDFVNVVGECKHGLEMASLFCSSYVSWKKTEEYMKN